MALDLTGIYVVLKHGVATVSMDGVAQSGEGVMTAETYCHVIGGELCQVIFDVAAQLAAVL